MSKSYQISKWATNATYPAGAFPWSGGPLQIAPSLAIAAAGFTPNAQVPAQVMNFLESNSQSAVEVTAHAAMRTWQSASHNLAGGGALDIVAVRTLASTFVNAPNDTQRFISVFGPNSTDSNKAWQTISADADIWFAQGQVNGTGIATGMLYTFAVAGDAGVVLVSNGGFVAVSHDSGATWATSGVYVGTDVLGMHWAPFSGGTYVAVDTDGKVRTGSSLVASTAASISGVTSFGSFGAGFYADIADNGAGTIVFVCRANSDTNFSAFTSTDSGATWAKTLTLAGTHASVTYNKAAGVFAVFDDTGLFHTSPIGSSWVTTITGITPGANFVGRGRMASAGPAIAITLAMTGLWSGVAYTLDLGATWNTWAFCGTNALASLRGINGRLYALNGTTIWQSGQLASPDADLVV